jgi:hypothetical protein
MVLKNFARYIINKCLSAHVEELDCERFDVDLRNGKERSSGMQLLRDSYSTLFFIDRACLLATTAFEARSTREFID